MERRGLKISAIKYSFYIFFGIALLLQNRAQAQSFRFLIPKDLVIQHAGSIGYMSVGAGYTLFKNKRGSLDFNFGYVPEARGGELSIVSAKFAYRPWKIKVHDGITLYPANPGLFVSYHLGKQFDLHWDKDTYEDGYYWWSTAFRPHISLSTEVNLDGLKVLKTSKIKGLSIYSEFNTNELYMISYFQNSDALSLAEVFKLGIGVRLHF